MILLDSHAFLWLLDDPDRLGPAARSRLERAATRYVSSVTQVEFRIKEMTGRLRMPPGTFDSWEELGLTPLPFTHHHARAMSDFPELARHDPFDRMLLAQARADGLEFVTADRHLLSLGLAYVTDARQ